ncbi:MAG: AraC family transcriptional regulator [Labilithrix sp.]
MASNSAQPVVPLCHLGLESPHASQLVLGAPWGATLPATGEPGLYVVKSGGAWIRSGERFQELVEGSVALLPRGSAHVLASHPDARTRPIADLCAEHGGGRGEDLHLPARGGREAEVDTFCFRVGSANARQLLRAAPEVVVLSPGAASAWTSHVARALSALLECERRDLVASVALTESLFGVVLRELLVQGSGSLHDQDTAITLAIALIHADLARPWTVATLARQVGRSKSRFHDQFVRHTGRAPIDYVTNARLEHAAELLQAGQASVQEIAEVVGYQTASGFSVAFRRWSGKTPSAVRTKAPARR